MDSGGFYIILDCRLKLDLAVEVWEWGGKGQEWTDVTADINKNENRRAWLWLV